jgi:hypothetical protein
MTSILMIDLSDTLLNQPEQAWTFFFIPLCTGQNRQRFFHTADRPDMEFAFPNRINNFLL